MSATTYTTMLKFAPDKLIDLFGQQYAYEYGEKKVKEIIGKIETSEKVKYYINNVIKDCVFPSPKELSLLMNTINYFVFSKSETICLGGLSTVLYWMMKTGNYQEYRFDDNVAQICADFILDCNRTKMNFNGSSFFDRFYREIDRIEREE